MQEEQKKTERKELCVFLLWTYGLTFLLRCVHEPAAGVMLAKLLYSKDRSKLPQKVFVVFLCLSVYMSIVALISFFLPEEKTANLSVPALFVILVLVISMFFEDKEKLKMHGLLGNKWKLSFKILLLFMLLLSFFMILIHYILYDKILCRPTLIMSIMTQFVIITPLCFGEEYGWRLYFQPLLQRKFGLRLGVLIFALLWDFWHFPVVLLYLGPQAISAGYVSSLGQYACMRLVHVFVLSIFLAYAYMKTENVWLAAMIHGFSNAFAMTLLRLYSEWNYGGMTWSMLGIWAVIEMVIFVPFLFSKVFRKPVKVTETEVEAKPEIEGVQEKE